MDKAICSECAEDIYLKKIIEDECEPVVCSVCGEADNKAISVQELGKLMEPIMREHFRLGGSYKRFGENDEEWWEQAGESMSWVVQQVLGQYFKFEDEIVDAVVDAENCWPPDGDEPFWESTTNYVETRVQIGHYYARWNWVLDELKHNRRFFNTSAEALFGEIFDGVDELQAWDGRRSRPVVRILSKGTTLFRARILNSEAMFKDVYAEPLKHIGPPPKEAARAGRMNAEGIVVFYGSREQKTCLAEMRPALGNELAVISLETTKPLRVLDFSRLDQARGGKVLSYFQPDFSSEVEKSAFLRRIHALISQPILPGKEADYLITQTMAEYLSHVHDKPFDGVLFASAQRNGGTNVVLFAKENMDLVTDSISDVFRLSYVDSTLEIFSTNSISYKHRKVDVYIDDKTGEPWRYDQHNGDHENE